MTMPPPFVVGLTGGIGSGKSAVAERFAARGAAIVDTDAIAHALTGPGGAAMAAIAAAFGPGVMRGDGALDRPAMRRLAFSDPAARQRLEAILHPLIRTESARQTEAAAAGHPYVLLAVPLLIESGSYRERCRRILVVDCPEALQITRVMARNQLSEDEVRAILAAQASRAERLAAADDVITNDGRLEQLDGQVAALDQRYRELAGSDLPSAPPPASIA
ncbi:dephospho-CoA kinase [Oryzomicrobium terrae]|uniref:Dephospho-CoA kinase n=1 Tax=Oryzomicrobium terrae TaxID=1735038 RepID=A0A5C1E6L1_9RHOO|nr:dephospho-CoA kinase [Oryzomicrobium terrae]QEL63947.1 dephospho-CoA kinase [Oryzomicrobium terrae]